MISYTRIQETRELMAEIGRLMFERQLTDAAGGNLGVRLDDFILMTPRYAGSRWRWRLHPRQILVFDLEGNLLDGEGEVSREARVHFTLLREFYPEGAAVVHAHPRNILVFCAHRVPLPSMLEATDVFGTVPLIPGAPSHTQALADQIAQALEARREILRRYAAAVLAPRHGIFILAKDLDTGYEALERLESSAYCALMGPVVHQRLSPDG